MPASTGDGVPELVIVRSAAAFTSVLTVVELLADVGSPVVAEIAEVAVIVVPLAVLALTFTVTTMFATVDAATLDAVHVMVPVLPTDGVVQVQPVGAETD